MQVSFSWCAEGFLPVAAAQTSTRKMMSHVYFEKYFRFLFLRIKNLIQNLCLHLWSLRVAEKYKHPCIYTVNLVHNPWTETHKKPWNPPCSWGDHRCWQGKFAFTPIWFLSAAVSVWRLAIKPCLDESKVCFLLPSTWVQIQLSAAEMFVYGCVYVCVSLGAIAGNQTSRVHVGVHMDQIWTSHIKVFWVFFGVYVFWCALKH